MPAEWEPHERTLVQWPSAVLLASGSPWPELGMDGEDWLEEAHYEELVGFISAASSYERVTVVVNTSDLQDCQRRLGRLEAVDFLEVEHCSVWLRDVGPSFRVGGPDGLAAIAWQWHGYGSPTGSHGAFKHSTGRKELYQNYCTRQWELFCNRDVTFSYRLAAELWCPELVEPGIAFEGGAVVVDGEGTGLVVWKMLSRMGADSDDLAELEDKLYEATGLEKIIWLPKGLEEQDDNSHADMVCAFVAPATVLLVANGERGEENFRALEGKKDAKGRPIRVFRVPYLPPSWSEAASSAVFGALGRVYAVRDRSYANLAFVRGAVLLPSYGTPDADDEAERVLREALAAAGLAGDREVVRVPWRNLSRFGGSLRCVSLPVPSREAAA